MFRDVILISTVMENPLLVSASGYRCKVTSLCDRYKTSLEGIVALVEVIQGN